MAGHPQRTLERDIDWRARCLRGAGFERSVANRLARDTAWDLHALLALVDLGCPPQLAERILAPLDRREVSP